MNAMTGPSRMLNLVLALAGIALACTARADNVYSESELTPELILKEVACGVPPTLGSCRQAIFSVLITFETGSSTLAPSAVGALDRMAAALRNEKLAQVKVRIVGHADPRGTAEGNLALSRDRAAAVYRHLVQKGGIDPSRVRSEGRGATRLLDPDDPTSARNRRVEFVFDH